MDSTKQPLQSKFEYGAFGRVWKAKQYWSATQISPSLFRGRFHHLSYEHRSYYIFEGTWMSHTLTLLWRQEKGYQASPKKCVFRFYSCQQFKVSLLILYSDPWEKKNTSFLINKTVGPQYSCDACHQGFPRLSSAVMLRGYLDSDGYISLGSFYLFCTKSITVFCFSGAGRTFCTVWQSCQTHQQWKFDLSNPSCQTYLIICLRCQNLRQQLSARAQSSRGHVLTLKRPDFILCSSNLKNGEWSFFSFALFQ